jgi:DNA primase
VGRFPQHLVEDLKAHADIVQVIQDTVQLRKSGNSYKGLCPFHNEKTPSFHVNSDKGFFHCFGCGTGGDVIKFVELQEKLSFPEAIEQLAQRFGIQIPKSNDSKQDAETDAKREELLKLHVIAAEYFRDQLAQEGGKRARSQLEARSIWPKTIEQLGLGYAPTKREGLKQALLKAGYSLDLLLSSGLIVERKGGQIVDRFNNRLMIPICRDTGSIIAFGGRALETGQQPKYVNSPETVLYSKGRVLYGLNITKGTIRRLGYSVIVEGYFDFAQALQAGVKNQVATCGTALTNNQTRLLRRFASKTILSFDPDPAGKSAASRCGELLVSEGFQVNVAVLDPGQDPDIFMRTQGAAQYMDKLRNSQPYLEYAIDQSATRYDFTRDEQRRAFLNEMLSIAAKIPDAPARDQFADRLSHKAQIMETVVRTEIRLAAIARKTKIEKSLEGNNIVTITPAEKGLLWAIMRDTAAAQKVLSGIEHNQVEGLATQSILQVARTLIDWPSETVPNTLLERLSQKEVNLVSQIAIEERAPAEVNDCGVELRRLHLERERAALQDAIDSRQRLGTPDAIQEIDELWKKKKLLLQHIETLGE